MENSTIKCGITKDDIIKDLKEENKELKEIQNRIKGSIETTITIIRTQPTGNDEWILDRLNGWKNALKEDK